jgi:hypothetical protein
MKTFKGFLNEEKEKRVLIKTLFGSHSVDKKKIEKQEKQNPENYRVASFRDTNFRVESVDGVNTNTENEITKPHTDAESNKFHSNNRVIDERPTVGVPKNFFGWLNAYSQNSRDMNNALYNDHLGKKIEKTALNDEERHQRNLTFAHEASKALANTRTKSDHTVFSGIYPEHAEAFKNQKKPIQAHHAGFISSSTDFNQAAKFAGKGEGGEKHMLRIHVPKGTQAGSMKWISSYVREKEILLQRGHDLEIHHEPTIINHPKEGKIHVWHAKIVGHKPKELNTKPVADVLYSHEKK